MFRLTHGAGPPWCRAERGAALRVSLHTCCFDDCAWRLCRDVDFKTVSYEPEVDAEDAEERADDHPGEVDI